MQQGVLYVVIMYRDDKKQRRFVRRLDKHKRSSRFSRL